ncbi:MAG: FtsW/RodA/SpoVE family cell cycle protein, partial [Pirellulales bacterium]|nr:FtsW/RodA/SpoVE family cell cycle protein [Pirellulales bacterium]
MKTSVWFNRIPWSIPLIALVLILVGCLGIDRYADLTGTGQSLLSRQLIWAVIAVAAMFAVTVPDYRVLCRWSYIIFLFAIFLLVAVYFFPPINAARRWIRIGPLGLQPSEFAKVAYVLALSRYLMYRENYRRLRGLFFPLMITLGPVLLILREPDLGTALVFFPVLFVMLFVAGARRRDLFLVAAAGLLLLPFLWS